MYGSRAEITGGMPGVPTVSFGNGWAGGLAGAVPDGAGPAGAVAAPVSAGVVGTAACVWVGSGDWPPVGPPLLLHAASVSRPASPTPASAVARVNERFVIVASISLVKTRGLVRRRRCLPAVVRLVDRPAGVL